MAPTAIPVFKGGETAVHALIDAEDFERVAVNHWRLTHDGYVCRSTTMNGRAVGVFLHRFVLNLPHGVRFAAGVVDHINGDKTDNRKANLRATTHSVNSQRGSRRVAESGYRGVYSRGRDWEAQISAHGSKYYLGVFPYPELAAVAYDCAARRHYGPHARTNFPAADLRAWLSRMADTMAQSEAA